MRQLVLWILLTLFPCRVLAGEAGDVYTLSRDCLNEGSRDAIASCFDDQGLVYQKRKEHEQAIQAYSKAVSYGYDSHQRLFEAYKAHGDFKKAVRHFTNLIQKNPERKEFYKYRAFSYLGAGDKISAVANMEKYAQMSQSPGGYKDLSDFYKDGLSDIPKALQALDRGVKAFPNRLEAYAHRANFHKTAAYNYNACIKDYSKVMQMDPGSEKAYLDDRAECLIKKGDKEAGLKDMERYLWKYGSPSGFKYLSILYHRDLRDSAGALAALDRGVEAFPDKAEAYLNRAEFYKKFDQDFEACVQDYTKALELDPELEKTYLDDRAECLLKKGDKESAVSDMQKHLRLSGSPAGYLSLAGFYQEELGDPSGAVAALEDGIREFPSSAELYLRRAGFHKDGKDYAACVQDYTQAIKLAPALEKEALEGRAQCFFGQGDRESGLKDMARHFELQGSPSGFLSLAQFYRDERKDILKAQDVLNRMVQSFPRSPQAYSARAGFYKTSKNYDACVQDYAKAIEMDPSLEKSALDDQAECLIGKGKREEGFKAIARHFELQGSASGFKRLSDFYRIEQKNISKARWALEAAVRALPGVPEAYLTLAEFHRDFARDDKACVEDYTKALQLNPSLEKLYLDDRAECLAQMGEGEKAAKDLERFAQINRSPEGFRSLSQFYAARMKDVPKALQSLDRGIAAFPNQAQPYAYRAEFHRSFAGDYGSCIQDYTRAISLEPAPSYFLYRAQCRQGREAREDRLADLLTAYRLARKKADLQEIRTAGLDLQKELMERGASAAAQGLLDRFIVLSSGTEHEDEGLENRGEYYLSLGESVLAERDFQRALDLSPGKLSTYHRLGLAALSREDRQGVLEACSHFKPAETDSSLAYGFAELYEKIQEYGQAGRIYAELFDLAGPQDPSRESLLTRRARVLLRSGNTEAAYRDAEGLKEFLDSRRQSLSSYYDLLSEIYATEGKYDKAVKAYKRARELNPSAEGGPGSYQMARLYLKTGQEEKALIEIDAYIRKNPEDAPGYLLRSEIYPVFGQSAEAARDVKKWKELSRGKKTLPDPEKSHALLVDSLIRILKSPDPQWRESSAWFLAGFQGEGAVEALASALEDEVPAVRKQALESLIQRKDPQLPQILSRASQGSDAELKVLAESALNNLPIQE